MPGTVYSKAYGDGAVKEVDQDDTKLSNEDWHQEPFVVEVASEFVGCLHGE